MRGSAELLLIFVILMLGWIGGSTQKIAERLEKEPVSANLLKEQIEGCLGTFKRDCMWANGTMLDNGTCKIKINGETDIEIATCLVKGDTSKYMRCNTIRFIDTNPPIVTDVPWYDANHVVRNVRKIECVKQYMGD